MPSRRLSALLVATALAATAAGCGDDKTTTMPTVRVALDFTPNPVHAPIYAAARTGADKKHGVRIAIEEPGSRPDSLKALVSGKADLGILDIQDLAIAREQRAPVVAIGALVERPLGALLAQHDITRPRDLNGKTVGVSGLPSDPAFLKAIVNHDGGDYESIKQVTIGFTAVSALASRKVDAVPVFWNVEGIILREKGERMNEFRIDDYGAPKFPEVVLMTTEAMLRDHRDRVIAALDAIRDGAKAVHDDPEPEVKEIAKAAGDADLDLTRAQFDALRPIVDPQLTLHRPVVEAWARFVAKVGLLDREPDVASAFVFGLH